MLNQSVRRFFAPLVDGVLGCAAGQVKNLHQVCNDGCVLRFQLEIVVNKYFVCTFEVRGLTTVFQHRAVVSRLQGGFQRLVFIKKFLSRQSCVETQGRSDLRLGHAGRTRVDEGKAGLNGVGREQAVHAAVCIFEEVDERSPQVAVGTSDSLELGETDPSTKNSNGQCSTGVANARHSHTQSTFSFTRGGRGWLPLEVKQQPFS